MNGLRWVGHTELDKEDLVKDIDVENVTNLKH